jgi:hypothetical protein
LISSLPSPFSQPLKIAAMKKTFTVVLMTAFVTSILIIACNNNQSASSQNKDTTMKENQTASANNDRSTQQHLRRFDSLDFQFYGHQQWGSPA